MPAESTLSSDLDALLEAPDLRPEVRHVLASVQEETRRLQARQAELELVTRAAHTLLTVPSGHVEEGIEATLGVLGQLHGVQRAYVFLLTADGSALADAWEWVADGVEGHDFDAFRGVSVEAFPWSMEHFLRGASVLVQDPAALPPEADPERGACDALSINDYVNTPMFIHDQLIGWLGFDSVGSRRTWSNDDVVALAATARVLAGGVERARRDTVRLQRQTVTDRAVAIGTMAAGLAHEINNPLTYLIGNVDLVGEQLLSEVKSMGPDDLTEVFADIRDGAMRIRQIVDDLRSFASNSPHPAAPIHTRGLLDSTLRIASRHVEDRARLVARYADVPKCVGNATGLGQVLLNLIINACQAIEPGDAAHNEVRITAQEVDGMVQIEVCDTGVGIAPDVLPRVFDPFFTTRSVGGGMGVGLAVSHRLITEMGGTIDISSSVGNGTTVRVCLPAEPKQEDRGHTVLLIDDEPGVLRLMARLVSPLQPVMATDGAEALAALRGGLRPDAILCDLMMPKVDGMAFYEALQEEFPQLTRRLAFITGGALSARSSHFLQTVDRPHLLKPFSAADLRGMVASLRAADTGPASVPQSN